MRNRNAPPWQSASKFRYERKYHLTESDAMLVRQRVSYFLTPDRHTEGSYQVSSVYFDDAHNTSLHQKRNGVFLRDKWRLRYYNNSLRLIHLERKRKRGELARKEQTLVTEEQYTELCRADMRCAARQESPVWKAFYTRHLLGRMRPVVVVDYDREAFSYAPGNVRLTFDTNLRAAMPGSGYSVAVDTGGLLILELKYDSFLPAVVAGLLSGVQFTQLAISKYVMARQALLGHSGR
ncbi:MAG: polyphosphate polymerase domain-containing protein [Desulfovibrio sp.]|jgi:hypothetical protein|nr:polyphosphate polymerase domain-containing protein [Desulfovibrio sp.]